MSALNHYFGKRPDSKLPSGEIMVIGNSHEKADGLSFIIGELDKGIIYYMLITAQIGNEFLLCYGVITLKSGIKSGN